MVFYVIAASEKNQGQPVPEEQVKAHIARVKHFTDPRNPAELHDLKVDKTQFKIGSLDQLMTLNETSSKLDTQLDGACKKFERVCFDTGSSTLVYKDEMDDTKTSKHPSPFLTLMQ